MCFDFYHNPLIKIKQTGNENNCCHANFVQLAKIGSVYWALEKL